MAWFRELRNWIIIFVWIAAAISCVPYLLSTPEPFKIGGISAPKSESAQAEKLMDDKLPNAGSKIFILYVGHNLTTNQAEFKKEVEQSLNGLKKLPYSHKITSPYDNADQISKDKHAAYAVVVIKNKSNDETSDIMDEFHSALNQPDNLDMYIGGQPSYISDINRLSQENLVKGESIAFPLSIIALIFIFKSVVAAFLPLLSSMISITIIISALYYLGQHIDLTVFVLNIATMLGLGLTLDYTLIITYRFREELAHGNDKYTAIKTTLRTAGKAVLFSGLTVLISIGSLLFFPINVLHSIGVGGIVVTITSILSALTFLPAALCLLGNNINALKIPFLSHNFSAENAHHSWWYKFTVFTMRHPLCVVFPTMLFLLLLGYPFLKVQLSRSDTNILPAWTESRQLHDEFSHYFNVNELSPINVVLISADNSILTKNNIGSIYDFAKNVSHANGVQSIHSIVNLKTKLTKKQYQSLYTTQQARLNSDQKQLLHETTKNNYTVMTVISKYAVNSENSFQLVDDIRNKKVKNNITHLVTGNTAVITDTIDISYDLFFKMILVISALTYIILLILLRSVILPLKAILMNFLSLSVCYGMLVYIFQEGNFSNLIGFQAQGYTDMNLPILLFFTLFGISMDYEVFLLSRIKEFYCKTHNNTLSVCMGLERSARIITSAALLVVIVAISFVTADIVFIKAFGLATALAVTVDATIIRILLVPATMRLLGDWNWYLPKWLDKILPDFGKFD